MRCGRERRSSRGILSTTRQRTRAARQRKPRRRRRNRSRRPSPETLGTQQAPRMERPPSQRYRCRGVRLARTVHHHRPPNCGASTCRRLCSAAGWSRRRTPSRSPELPQPGPVPAASPFSRPFGPPRRHRPLTRPPPCRPAHQPSLDRRTPGCPRPNQRERRPNLCRLEPRGEKRCFLERCRLIRSRRGPRPRLRLSRPRRHRLCRWAARHWRPRRLPPCLLGARNWQQPRPRSRHRPNPLGPRRTWRPRLHRPCPHHRVRRRHLLPRATTGSPIRAGSARALAGAAPARYRCPRRCRPAGSHGGRAGLTASPA